MEEIMFFLLIIGAESQMNLNQVPPSFDLQAKPDRCNRPAEFMYRQCCIFPPFFTRDVAKLCGAFFELISVDKVNNITALRRSPSTLCEHWRCVLQKYELLNSDESLNDEKYFQHIDRWAELNPSFTEVLGKGKIHCMSIFRMFLPLTACEFYDLHGCIRNFVNTQCPVLFPTKECQEHKLFFDECREYYI